VSLPQTLPPQTWAATAAGTALLSALEAGSGETRLVGGAVRDGLLGLGGADIDLATRFSPDEVMKRVKAAHFVQQLNQVGSKRVTRFWSPTPYR
jgi:poly(A) polymerase